MKLHISGNALRLSISDGDLSRLRWDGHLSCWMGLSPGRRFTYGIELRQDVDRMAAVLQDDALTILMPQDEAAALAKDDSARCEAMQPIDGDQQLHIVVEKEVLHHADVEEVAEAEG